MTSDAISRADVKATLDKYGEIISLWHTPRISIVEFRKKKNANKLAEEKPFTVGDVTVTPIPPSFAPEVTKGKTPQLNPNAPKSKELRLLNVPVGYGADPAMVLNLLKPFDVVSVEMLSFKVRQAQFFWAWAAHALFATQEGADRALAAMYSDSGIVLFNHKIYGKYMAKSADTSGESWIKAVA